MSRILTLSPRVLLLVSLLFVALSYSNSLYSPLVLDDYSSFVESQEVYIKDFSLASLEQLANTRFGKTRFLPLLSFAIDHRLGSGSIIQFHLTNIGIHLLTSCAIFIFLQGILLTPRGRQALHFFAPGHFTLFVCILWALNPVQTNAVTYLVQRMASLAALFYLAALACYVYGRLAVRTRRRLALFGGAAVFATCAALSKENTATLPLAILLVEWLFLSSNLKRHLKRLLSRKLNLALLIIGAFIFALLASKEWHALLAGYDLRHFTLAERLLTELRIVVFYVSLLVLPLPSRMNLDHDFPISHSMLEPPTTILALLFLSSLLFAATKKRDSQPLIAFGIFWFFLQLVIESSFVPLELIFEHRLYLPSVGFFVAALAIADLVFAKARPLDREKLQQAVFLFLVILTSLSSLLTTLRNHDWRDLRTIYADCLAKSPNKPRALVNYAIALGREKEYDEAIQVLKRAIALGRPGYEDYVKAANNIMVCHIEQGDFEGAIKEGEHYLREMRKDVNADGFPKLMYNLGFSYMKTGRYADAESSFITGLRQEPDMPFLLAALERLLITVNENASRRQELGLSGRTGDPWLKLATILLDLKSYTQASLYLEKARRLMPEEEDVAAVYERHQEEERKNKEAHRLSQLASNSPLGSDLSELCFSLLLRVSSFILESYPPLLPLVGPLLTTADRLTPDDPFVPVLLARWLLLSGNPEKARTLVESILILNNDFPPLLEVAGNTYLAVDEPAKAAICFDQLLSVYPGHPRWKFFNHLIRQEVELAREPSTQVGPKTALPGIGPST